MLERDFKEQFWSSIESIDLDKHIILVYSLKFENVSPIKVAEEICVENSTGTWTPVSYETLDIRKEHGAKTIGLYSTHSGDYVIMVAVNSQDYDPEKGGLSALLADVAGNVYEIKMIEKIKLLDIFFPRSWLSAFRGPKYGIEGVREMTNTLDYRRPLIGAIVKPNIGLDPRTISVIAYEVALGGVDFIKDDEGLVETSYCSIEDKVSYVEEALDKACEETGKRAFYVYNITADKHEQVVRMAELVKSLGGKHLMISGTYSGFGVVRMLAEDESINLPIFVHTAGKEAFTRLRDYGISAAVFSKIWRIVGADEVLTSAIAGKFHVDLTEAKRQVIYLRSKLYNFKPSFPVIAAGLHPGSIKAACDFTGNDILIFSGGGILGHPMGATAGAKAMLQAVMAWMENIDPLEFSKGKPELANAIELWGVRRLEE